MSKVSIFRIEDAGIDNTDALRVELFRGTDPESANTSYQAVIFRNQLGRLYKRLSDKLGDNDEWECNEKFSDCVVTDGDAQRIKVPTPFYRFERNKKGQYVKATPERVVKYAKMVWFEDGPTFEEQIDRYLSNVPDECKIEPEEKEEKDKES